MKTILTFALLLPITASQAQSHDAQSAQQAAVDAAKASQRAQQAEVQALRAKSGALSAARDQQLSQLDALRADVDGLGALDARVPTEQEQLAIAALRGLMSVSPERALPLLKKVLNGKQSDLVKSRALFVLAQTGHKEAPAILLETAKRGSVPLQLAAVRAIGVGGDPASIDALDQVYASNDPRVKAAVLDSLMVADRPEALYKIALAAKTNKEAAEAIRLLGAMGASEQLRRLGQAGRGGSELLDAFAISGDLASLRKLAISAPDQQTRIDATRGIGIIDTAEAKQALREIYQASKTTELKEAVLEGLLIADDSEGVLALYRAATTPQEKRMILRTLSVMDSDAAMQAIDAALEGNSP